MELCDIERRAYMEGRSDIVSIIQQSEEEASLEITWDHQLMIDDRNRLAAALEHCIRAIEPDSPKADALDAAYKAATEALRDTEPQAEETLTEKLNKANQVNESLRETANHFEKEARSLRQLKYTAQHLVRAFIGKHPPKWAQALTSAMKEHK